MKLISMTDFILQTKNDFVYSENAKYEDSFKHIVNYAEFLKQPLTLGMFVPCDENGNVLNDFTNEISKLEKGEIFNSEILETWEKAKEKVLFKDFIFIFESIKNFPYVYSISELNKMKIEDLIDDFKPLDLTKSALKQIGLNP